MAKLEWDKIVERRFETGLSHGVLYAPDYDNLGGYTDGVAWNGLVSIEEDRNTAEPEDLFLDGIKYMSFPSPGDYSATLKAYTYPDEFMQYDGLAEVYNGMFLSDQMPKSFAISYRTEIGTTDGVGELFKLHVVYNLTSAPSPHSSDTIDQNSEVDAFEWKISAGAPQIIEGYRPTAHFIFDSRKVPPRLMEVLSDIVYGDDDNPPSLPTAKELFRRIDEWRIWKVQANNDLTWTATTEYDDLLNIDSNGLFTIDNIDSNDLGDGKYTIQDTILDPEED